MALYLLLSSIVFFAGSVLLMWQNFKILSVLSLVLAISINLTAVVHYIELGRARGLVESCKYEIVTNEDYSKKYLKDECLKISGYYLRKK